MDGIDNTSSFIVESIAKFIVSNDDHMQVLVMLTSGDDVPKSDADCDLFRGGDRTMSAIALVAASFISSFTALRVDSQTVILNILDDLH